MEQTHRDRISNAIGVWIRKIDTIPGWRAYRAKRLMYTLGFDDQLFMPCEAPGDFVFPPDIEKQHTIVMQYLGLQQTIEALKESEFYFRRYPFRGLPVSRHTHLTNVCEMYFGRFYEFKERLKKYLNMIHAVDPAYTLEVGKFIKLFENVFDQELRARNKAHHHERFDDIVINKVFITDVISISKSDDSMRLKRQHIVAYRKAANEWSKRVRASGAKMDEFLEAVAEATLTVCNFLTP